MKNGLSSEEATRVAREYMDFAQGGSVTKALDDFIPYVNASIQGTRGTLRAMKDNPKLAAYKVAQLLSIGAGLAFWNRKLNEEAWEEISPRQKATNFIITTPFTFTDAEGRKRHIYFSIPKDQGQQLFSAVGAQMAEKMAGESTDKEELIDAATQLLPADVGSMIPPTLSAAMSYTFNKDFWRNQDIWKGAKVSPKNEYTKLTPEAYVKLGKITGMSPDRLNTAVSEVLPSNGYTALIGQAWNGMRPSSEISRGVFDRLSSSPIIRRFIRTTYPSQFTNEDIRFIHKHDIPMNQSSRKIRAAMQAARTATADKNIEAKREKEKLSR
jgi:hypothetical protein